MKKSATAIAFGIGGIVLLLIVAAAGWKLWQQRTLDEELHGHTSPSGYIRGISTAMVMYSSIYGNGFPQSLEILGPPQGGASASCRAADLIDAASAKGERGGYRFEYRPGPSAEEKLDGCPRGVISYSIVMRPITYGSGRKHSFFVDETGVVRVTSQRRDATKEDPPLSTTY